MYIVYILYSKNFDRFYVGQTNDIEKRIIRHNSGYVKSTKNYRPWEVVYQEYFDTRAQAMRREKELKAMKSKVFLRELVDAFGL